MRVRRCHRPSGGEDWGDAEDVADDAVGGSEELYSGLRGDEVGVAAAATRSARAARCSRRLAVQSFAAALAGPVRRARLRAGGFAA